MPGFAQRVIVASILFTPYIGFRSWHCDCIRFAVFFAGGLECGAGGCACTAGAEPVCAAALAVRALPWEPSQQPCRSLHSGDPAFLGKDPCKEYVTPTEKNANNPWGALHTL